MVTSRRARVVGLCVMGMLLIQFAWLLAVPPFFGIDEIDHTYRASSIWQGDLRPLGEFADPDEGRGDLVAVRSDVAGAAHRPCLLFNYYGKANCTPVGAGPHADTSLVASSAARYNPVFYAIEGAAAEPFSGYDYVYALRVAAALLCTAMFGAGIWCLLTFARTRWPVALFLLATTPMTLYSTTVAAPNGLEMVSGLTLWAALLGLFCSTSPPSSGERRVLLTITAVSGATLVTVHTLGPLWLGLIAIVVLVLAHPVHIWRRVRAHPVGHLAAAATVVLATLGSLAWVLSANANDPASEHLSLEGSPFPKIFGELILWPLQAIGTYPSRNEGAPVIVYAMAVTVFIWVSVIAARHLRGRVLSAVVLLAVLSVAVPFVLTLATYAQIGLAWQGRYGLPFSCGYFLILGLALDQAPVPPRVRSFPLGVAAVLLAAELAFSLHGVVHRALEFGLWRDNPHWYLPGMVVLVLAVIAGTTSWFAAVVRSAPPGSAPAGRPAVPAIVAVPDDEPVRSSS